MLAQVIGGRGDLGNLLVIGSTFLAYPPPSVTPSATKIGKSHGTEREASGHNCYLNSAGHKLRMAPVSGQRAAVCTEGANLPTLFRLCSVRAAKITEDDHR